MKQKKHKRVELGEVLHYEQPTKYIVSSVDYNNNFATPVLTAGKSFILGYTDEENGIFPQEKLPVIIFDDFTTAIKFVDFPFKVKSSAMKILHADKSKADIKFLFYAMQTIDFTVRKHKRHWISEYSKIKISLPSLVEQKQITDKLDKVSTEIKKGLQYTKKSINTAGTIFESRVIAILEKGRKSGWEEVRLDKVFKFFNGKAHEKYISSIGKYKVVNSKFISSNGLIYKRTDKQLFPLMRGDITMVMSDVPNGKALAKCFVIDKDDTYTLNQRICVLRPLNKVDIRFFYQQLNRNSYLLAFDNGQRQTNLRKEDILGCPLLVPDLPKQEKISDELEELFSQSKELTVQVQKQQELFDLLYSSALNQSFQIKT